MNTKEIDRIEDKICQIYQKAFQEMVSGPMKDQWKLIMKECEVLLTKLYRIQGLEDPNTCAKLILEHEQKRA